MSDYRRFRLVNCVGVGLCLGAALSGCAVFRTYKYVQAVPHGREIFTASRADRLQGKPDSLRDHLPKDKVQVEMKGPAPISMPVFWRRDGRGGIPNYDFEIIGEVSGEAWPGLVFGAIIAEPYLRQGSQVAGADAVVFAGEGPLYPSGSIVYCVRGGW